MKVMVLALVMALVPVSVGCTKQSQSGTQSTTTSAGTMTPVPDSVRAQESVTFNFTDVAVSTSGNPVLRLGFDAKNNGKDPALCDESSFSAELSDGSVLPPDAGAQNVCDPDSIDPGATSKVVMFFDLPNGYSGPVTVYMRSSDNTLVGQGTTSVH